MKIRVVLFGLAACATLCAMPPIAGAKIFPMIFVTNLGSSGTAAASPFGGNGTIDTIDIIDNNLFGQPQVLVHSLAMPIDIAVSDNIVYAVIEKKGIITAFSAKTGEVINNGKDGEVTTVPKGRPVGIAAFGGNVFVADSSKSTIIEYNSAGTPGVMFNEDVNLPTEITVSGGKLFVVNQGKNGKYISEYTTSGDEVAAQLIKGLQGPIQIAVSGTDLFVTHLSAGTIDEYDVTSGLLLESGFITGLNGPTDIATFGKELFVTDVPHHSIDVYDIATGELIRQIDGLHGPQGIDIVSTPDLTATWLLLLIGLAAVFALRLTVRQPA
jgi:hypothetical protein